MRACDVSSMTSGFAKLIYFWTKSVERNEAQTKRYQLRLMTAQSDIWCKTRELTKININSFRK